MPHCHAGTGKIGPICPIGPIGPILLVLATALILSSCKSTPPPTTPTAARPNAPPSFSSSALTFTGRRPDGAEIALSDRTKWTIQPAGTSATLRWSPGEPLTRTATGDPYWPTALISQASGAIALARPAGRF